MNKQYDILFGFPVIGEVFWTLIKPGKPDADETRLKVNSVQDREPINFRLYRISGKLSVFSNLFQQRDDNNFLKNN